MHGSDRGITLSNLASAENPRGIRWFAANLPPNQCSTGASNAAI